MPLPEEVRRRLHVAHDLAPLGAEVSRYLDALALAPAGDAGAEPAVDRDPCHQIAADITAALADEPRQLGKVMVALWREPRPELRRIAAACCAALGDADLKRLLRFLQKAERKLGDAAACDALAAACAAHVRAHPALFVREAQNRLTSKHALVRRLGMALILPLATDAAFRDPEALYALLRPHMSEQDPVVRDVCVDVVVALHARDAERSQGFLAAFRTSPGAQPTIAAVRRRLG